MILYKLLVFGDKGSNKDELKSQLYLNRVDAGNHDPTTEDSCRRTVIIDDQPRVLEILDTVEQEEGYNDLCDQLIRDSDGFLIVYSISDRLTFERAERYQDLITRAKNSVIVPVILVGNNCHKVEEREVSKEEGMDMARKLGCGFIEVSGRTCINLERTFYTIARMIRESRENKNYPRPEMRSWKNIILKILKL